MLPRLSTTASPEALFAIYLADHDAAAAAAVALAHRAAGNVRHAGTRDQITRVARDIAADREVLREVMAVVGAQPAAWKVVGAHVAERLGRLKLNGQVLRPSPLGNVVELEGLLDAVAAKRRLWQTIAEVPGLQDAAGIDVDHLLQRADDQEARLHPLWLAATGTAFPGTRVDAPPAR